MAMGVQDMGQKADRRLILQTQRLDDRQHALSVKAAAGTVGSEAFFPPDHAGAEHAFGVVVGRLHSLDSRERPHALEHL